MTLFRALETSAAPLYSQVRERLRERIHAWLDCAGTIDLIVGTSTGALIALGLGADASRPACDLGNRAPSGQARTVRRIHGKHQPLASCLPRKPLGRLDQRHIQ